MRFYMMEFHEAPVKESFEERGAAQKLIPPFMMGIIMPCQFETAEGWWLSVLH